jgi:hypothetical protein
MRTLCRRLRPGLLAVGAAIVVAAVFGLPAPNAQAFFIQNHERITRDALPPGEVDNTAMLQILAGPANLFQADRHAPCWG